MSQVALPPGNRDNKMKSLFFIIFLAFSFTAKAAVVEHATVRVGANEFKAGLFVPQVIEAQTLEEVAIQASPALREFSKKTNQEACAMFCRYKTHQNTW